MFEGSFISSRHEQSQDIPPFLSKYWKASPNQHSYVSMQRQKTTQNVPSVCPCRKSCARGGRLLGSKFSCKPGCDQAAVEVCTICERHRTRSLPVLSSILVWKSCAGALDKASGAEHGQLGQTSSKRGRYEATDPE